MKQALVSIVSLYYNCTMEIKNETEGAGPTIDSVEPRKTHSGFWSGFGDFARFAVIVVAIVAGVRIFIAQPFIVSGTSMVPTFENNNYLIIDELSYRFHEPKRGDVIVFHPPFDPKTYYIKRVIGVPGDTVNVRNGVVTITNTEHPQGFILKEPYAEPDTLVENVTLEVTPGNLFVMGDNRSVSYDSRRWGLLPETKITGRAFLRLFPVNELGILPGEHNY